MSRNLVLRKTCERFLKRVIHPSLSEYNAIAGCKSGFSYDFLFLEEAVARLMEDCDPNNMVSKDLNKAFHSVNIRCL